MYYIRVPARSSLLLIKTVKDDVPSLVLEVLQIVLEYY